MTRRWPREFGRMPCDCDVNAITDGPAPPHFHDEPQDIDGEAWNELLAVIDGARRSEVSTFAPIKELRRELRPEIITLPVEIAELSAVTHLDLYGSNLRSVPPEIGQMSSLEHFDPYQSHSLHWFPYEITRCSSLRDSRVSTRSLYGNGKYRPPFPSLPFQLSDHLTPTVCSVCESPFGETPPMQRWISLRIATDTLPLLVHACGEDCVDNLPTPPKNYVDGPHEGGPELVQPPVWDEL